MYRFTLSLLIFFFWQGLEQKTPPLNGEKVADYLKLWHSQKGTLGPIAYNLGQLYLEKEAWDSAQYFFHQSLRYLPDSMGAHAENQLGWLEIQQKNPREALRHFRMALIKDPKLEVARINFERCLQDQASPPPLPPMHRPDLIPPYSEPLAFPSESQARTILTDTLPLESFPLILLRIRDREFPYVQQLTRRPRSSPREEGRPAW